MASLPESIQNLIGEFNKLPGIGPKTSEKFVYYLLSQPKDEIDEFVKALTILKEEIKICETCFNFCPKSPCNICNDSKRNSKVICVVADSADLQAIENTGEFNGLYHVLGGTINQIDGIGPEKLKIKELIKRIQDNNIEEIILGLNPNMEGETTTLYLKKELNPLKIKVTRLARGLPMGADLEYADEMTLTDALKGRNEI
ncbi:MAG: recombination mediator RecR [Patescibacteria group bacterium]